MHAHCVIYYQEDYFFIFVYWLVCLFVSRITPKPLIHFYARLGGGMGHGPGKDPLNLWVNPLKGGDPGMFIPFSSKLQVGVAFFPLVEVCALLSASLVSD